MAPLGHWPWAARVVTGLAAAGLGWTALSLTRETGGRRAPSLDGAPFALRAVLVVVLNPLAWSHYAIMLVLPALLILAMAADPGVSLTTGARRVVFAMVGAALTLLSVPKETLFRHIAPVPVTPVRSAGFLALHFDGALLLFAAAAYLARPRGSGSLAAGRRGKEPALAGGGSLDQL